VQASESTAPDDAARAAARSQAQTLWLTEPQGPEETKTQASPSGDPEHAALALTAMANYEVGKWRQFRTIFQREMLLRSRSKMLFKAFVGRTIIMTVLIGAIWWDILGDPAQQQPGVQSTMGVLQMVRSLGTTQY
jgi:hypothetical protein